MKDDLRRNRSDPEGGAWCTGCSWSWVPSGKGATVGAAARRHTRRSGHRTVVDLRYQVHYSVQR